MPLRKINLADRAFQTHDKEFVELIRVTEIVETKKGDNKPLRANLPERARFTLGNPEKPLSILNGRTSDKGYHPYVGISECMDVIIPNLMTMQEAYLKEALRFVTESTETPESQWTLVRSVQDDKPTLYINHREVGRNVVIVNGNEATFHTNDANYTGTGAVTINAWCSVNVKESIIRFKIGVSRVGLYAGREVESFSDDLNDVDLPDGVFLVKDSPNKRRRN